MPYTKQEKIELLKSTKRICMIVINECKLKLPMLKMTYPESICTFNNLKPNYKYTIEMCMKSIGNINKMLNDLKDDK